MAAPAKHRAACAALAGHGPVMAENRVHVPMLKGHDAAHRTRNLDTHLTHGCIQLFRHSSRWRSDSASSRLPKNGGLPPFSETAERSEEHTSELKSLMRISYDVFCLTKSNNTNNSTT